MQKYPLGILLYKKKRIPKCGKNTIIPILERRWRKHTMKLSVFNICFIYGLSYHYYWKIFSPFFHKIKQLKTMYEHQKVRNKKEQWLKKAFKNFYNVEFRQLQPVNKLFRVRNVIVTLYFLFWNSFCQCQMDIKFLQGTYND